MELVMSLLRPNFKLYRDIRILKG